jgi:hypothetical protein
MKKLYFLLFSIMISSLSLAQGLEDFTNSNATTSYADNSFVGNNGITWSYVASRDANSDANMSGINLPALMLRRVASGSKITSSSISGGITDFSVKLYKGFTGSGDRQVELFVNGVSYGTSTPFDDFTEQTFSVTGINVPGNVVIEIVNITARQVIIDDITWTGFSTSCGVILGQGTYICNSSTVGDNNDGVTVNIPYTGSDAGITSVTTTSLGTVSGDSPASVANGTITITGLNEGDTWDVVLNGGDCDTFSASGTVPAAECDPIPNTCIDLSAGPDLFESVTVATNSDMDVWTESAGTYTMNGFCGGGCAEQVETWLVFGPLDMSSVTDLALAFDATEQFGVTDLNISYTSAYSGCPSGTSWTIAQTITDAGSYSVDLSAASGTDVYIGVEYNDDGTDGYSGWDLSNVSLNAFGTCPTLGTVVPSDCAVCDVTLQTESYVCATNTDGSNNDGVTVNIPYSGMDNTIISISTPGATLGGDDPALTADGTIILNGLIEGDPWSITLNGGDCDGTTLSGTVPATECDPEIVVINEIHADPSNNVNGEGDANGDGVAEFDNDEFVEIYNTGTVAIDMENYTLEDGTALRHIFPTGTILNPNSFITVFGGGTPTGIAGLVQVASEGNGLSLNNGGDTITLKDNNGIEVVAVTYGSAGNNQSIGRDPDFTGPFVDHSTIAGNGGALFSPNKENDDVSLSDNEFATTVFSIYPNPTDSAFVTISSKNNDAMIIQVFDLLGKQIKNEILIDNTLNVSNLKSGIYLVKITQNNTSVTKKLVIK